MSGPGSKSKAGTTKASTIEGFGEVDASAVAAYGQQLASLELDDLSIDEAPIDDDAVTGVHEIVRDHHHDKDNNDNDVTAARPVVPGAAAKSGVRARPPVDKPDKPDKPVDKPNLEPVGEEAHPPQNRRMPTLPPTAMAAALELDLDERAPSDRGDSPASPAASPTPPTPTPTPNLAPPPRLGPRQSPAPVRRGLFSTDRLTNLLGGAAVGLVLMIFPAKQLAHRYEVREVEPLIAELEAVVEQPLGVEAGRVERPESIVASIEAGRSKVRRRYFSLWLAIGLPLGVGISFLPRPE